MPKVYIPVGRIHKYCLACYKPGCLHPQHEPYKFIYSRKLRVPLTLKNKKKWRDFLNACPIFVNGLRERDDLQDRFIKLLREVDYYDTEINGVKWTKISKKINL